MKTIFQTRSIVAAIAVLLLTIGSTPGQEAADSELQLNELQSGMGAEDMNARREAQAAWQAICFELGAPGNEGALAVACRLMAAHIGPDTPIEARVWLLKQLERHGGDECVAAVAKQLHDQEPRICDAARRALANNSAPQAGESLREALAKSRATDDRIAIILALGYRGEAESVETLADLLVDEEQTVANAAAGALGRIGNAVAAQRLSSALTSARGELQRSIASSLVRCAVSLAESGDMAQAKGILTTLVSAGPPANAMALPTLLAISGEQEGAVLLAALQKDDDALHDVALHCVGDLNSDSTALLADGLDKLTPELQVRLLKVLNASRDRAAQSGVRKALDSRHPVVQIAAIEALGGVGGASDVTTLLDTMLTDGEAGNAARRALENSFIEGVDDQLIRILRASEDSGRRAILIEILDRRRAVAAVPALLDELASEDSQVSSLALTALGRLASSQEVPAIIAQQLKGPPGNLPDAVQRAIVEICRRVPEEAGQAAPVLTVYSITAGAERIALLPLLGRIGGERTLTAIRTAIEANDPAQVEAGITALTNWPTAEVATELAKLAETLEDEGQKIRVIRGLARVVVLDSYFSDDEELALLKRAMKQAARDDERRLILDRAREARSFATVEFAAEYLGGDQRLAEQACRTIVDLLRRSEIRSVDPSRSDEMLQRVIATTENEGLAANAREYLSDQ